uniref:Uncharacterized protein n=1 Tax=Arundo donax TaxID=35708 RepID=A0A0A8YYX8_ARUDO
MSLSSIRIANKSFTKAKPKTFLNIKGKIYDSKKELALL